MRLHELLNPLPVQHLPLSVLLKPGTIAVTSRHLHVSVRAAGAPRPPVAGSGQDLSGVSAGCARHRTTVGPVGAHRLRDGMLARTLAGSVQGGGSTIHDRLEDDPSTPLEATLSFSADAIAARRSAVSLHVTEAASLSVQPVSMGESAGHEPHDAHVWRSHRDHRLAAGRTST